MSKSKKMFAKLAEQECVKFGTAFKAFFPNQELAQFVPSSEDSILTPFFTRAKDEITSPEFTQVDLEFAAWDVRRNIKAGKPGNVEIQLNKGRLISDKKYYPLGNSILKMTPWDDSTGVSTNPPSYLFVKEGDTLEASIFLGSEPAMGILAMADEDGDVRFQRLSEFYMFAMSTVEDDEAQADECAVMTSYHWLLDNVATSVLFGNRLDTVKTILLADWLQEEWQKAKEAKQESSKKGDGDRE